MTNAETYERLIAYLDQNGAQYRLIDHPPEGRTDIVSPMRGHPVSAAAKCLILMVKVGRKVTKYVLGVRPWRCAHRSQRGEEAQERHLRFTFDVAGC